MSNAKVELFDVALKKCNYTGLSIPTYTSETTVVVATRCEFANSNYGAIVEGSLTSATFKNCVFHDNEEDGIQADDGTIHLHGEDTAIHSNGSDGIHAVFSPRKCTVTLWDTKIPSYWLALNTQFLNVADVKLPYTEAPNALLANSQCVATTVVVAEG